MATKAELEEALRTFPGSPEVTVVGNGTLVATIVSASFAGEDEGERQARVWDHLAAHLGESKMQNVEFIFTNAPGDTP